MKFVPQVLYGPPHPDQEYLDAVRAIFDSGERGTIEALKSNITQFHEQVKEKKQLREMQKQINELIAEKDDKKNADAALPAEDSNKEMQKKEEVNGPSTK